MFAFCLRVLDVHYRLAYVFAFCVAVTNNFVWNRVWTFRHERDASHMAMQGARFFAVSLLAAAAGFVLLETFVRARHTQDPRRDARRRARRADLVPRQQALVVPLVRSSGIDHVAA